MVSDELTPAQTRRFQIWRALADLARAQEEGSLTADQVRLLEALANNLQQLANHLNQLADLGQSYAGLLDQIARAQTGGLPGPSSAPLVEPEA